MKAERELFSLPSRFHVVGITSMKWASLRLRGDDGGGGESTARLQMSMLPSRVTGACNFMMYLLPMPIHTS